MHDAGAAEKTAIEARRLAGMYESAARKLENETYPLEAKIKEAEATGDTGAARAVRVRLAELRRSVQENDLKADERSRRAITYERQVVNLRTEAMRLAALISRSVR